MLLFFESFALELDISLSLCLGRGNPAKDAPPQYYVDSKTGEVALVSPSNPGNIFPSV